MKYSCNHRSRWIIAGLAIFLAAQASPVAAQTLALVGGSIETVSEAGRIESGNLIVQDGKIQAVGADEKIPETAQVIDVSGKVLMPGVIDPYFGAVTVRTIVIGGRTFRIGGSSTSTPTYSKVADTFDPHALNTRAMLRSGVTQLNLVGSGYGQAAIVRNTPDNKDGMLAVDAGVMFATVSNSSTSLGVLRSGLGSSTSRSTTSRTSSTSPSKALWNEVKEGKRMLIVNAGNAAGILHLLKLVEPNKKIKLALVASGPDVYQAMPQIKKVKPILILSPTISNKPNSRFPINVPEMARRAGLKLAFSLTLSQSDLNASQDTPLFRVASLVRAGLPRKVALEALTTEPAKLLGVEKTHGSLAKDKLANVLVFDGDPLDPASQLEMVFVEGVKVYEK